MLLDRNLLFIDTKRQSLPLSNIPPGPSDSPESPAKHLDEHRQIRPEKENHLSDPTAWQKANLTPLYSGPHRFCRPLEETRKLIYRYERRKGTKDSRRATGLRGILEHRGWLDFGACASSFSESFFSQAQRNPPRVVELNPPIPASV
ncbi:uncharacterized protein CIMG_03078 [Coccidioides immitis RS]|uniref:Uncharacterized protein n=4 Tax=Coccidioides immitis TaxID=5501 RepID=A0A0E1RWK4_COCIM|nr:uncharacterized protein CIMG_03078 [Coccidioides immitis RS]KMP07242.1 hypothetical protein CIRG_06923 [Coccidioides immitis RMSCC 2394]KMU78022.1 hypothetical protein CISG_06784 [Coccidioides immitis RMSCC 3703]KMU82317.1 hypothetical protein CIHG_00101 [Coccidioides immitis H538.4]TPX19238.1 hypothetical protein DIZ76_017026 [Coccidioides immitis]EAS32054.1 hypothetical protein CIMG_03078 [Coccidioides immitis RS]